jgi:hypothetical protein
MRHENQFATPINDILNSRQSSSDPFIVGNCPAFQRHIEINAHEDAPAFGFQIING